jgi:hypothetical protein
MANERLSGTARTNALRNAVRQLTWENPKAAAEIAVEIPPGEERNNVMGDVLRRWSNESPTEAMAFIEKNLPDGTARESAMRDALSGWMNVDPKAALNFAVNSGKAKPQDVGGYVANWARQDSTAALAWANGQPEGPTKTLAVAGAIGGLANTDPDRAKKLMTPALLAGLPDDARAQLTAGVASGLARKSPAEALEWADSLADSKSQKSAIETTSRIWADTNPVAAAEWIDKLAVGEKRDAATVSYASVVQNTDPEGAAVWAGTVSDMKLRESAVSGVVRRWANTDKKAAIQWVESTPSLTPEMKERLMPK